MRILLIGSGNRARAYAEYLKEEIAYVCDVKIEKAKLLIQEYGLFNTKACATFDGIKDIDGIVIAVPDYEHEVVFGKIVSYGVPVLLEKPVSVTNESLKRMYGIGIGFWLR